MRKSVAACGEYVASKPPFRWFTSEETHQILMLGVEGAGKTTLLYKLKIPGWKKDDIIKDMAFMKRSDNSVQDVSRDPCYHYEEFTGPHIGNYGIWDIPGNQAFRSMWPMFYRYLRFSSVLFVVDSFSSRRDDMDMLLKVRESIQILLNEDELRVTAFVLLLNVDRSEGDEVKEEELEREQAILQVLGVPEIMANASHKTRFTTATLNCAEAENTTRSWQEVLKFIHSTYENFGEGSGRFGH